MAQHSAVERVAGRIATLLSWCKAWLALGFTEGGAWGERLVFLMDSRLVQWSRGGLGQEGGGRANRLAALVDVRGAAGGCYPFSPVRGGARYAQLAAGYNRGWRGGGAAGAPGEGSIEARSGRPSIVPLSVPLRDTAAREARGFPVVGHQSLGASAHRDS